MPNRPQSQNNYEFERRKFLGVLAVTGGYGAYDFLDNGGIDGSPFRFISDFLGGSNNQEGGSGVFNGGYAVNNNRSTEESSGAFNTTETPVETRTETPDPVTETSKPTETPTDTPTDTPTETPAPTETPTDTPTDTPTTPTGGGGYNELGPACDRLYIQREEDSNNGNGDGTVVGLDLADREYRIFSASEFPYNEELLDLYNELEGIRGKEDLPAGLGEGVRTTREEVFEESVDAYDDMSDEEEWDIIFDENERSNCRM